MANPSTIPKGNISGNWALAVTLSPAAVGATTTSEQTFTVPGVQLGDLVDVYSNSAAQSGIVLGNARVSAINTIAIQFANVSSGTLTPTASTVYNVGITRPENLVNNVAILTQIP